MEHWPIKYGNKAESLRQLCEKHHVDLKDVIVVAHEDNDIKMAKSAGFSIAFNPISDELVKYCNKIIKDKSLLAILEPIKEFEKREHAFKLLK